jgi:hypothetical protein
MANKKPSDKSLEVIEKLLDCLDEFHGIPLRRAIESIGLEEKSIEDLHKVVDKSLIEAASLKTMIQALQHKLINSKRKQDPRFNSRGASERIISKFLSLNS